MVATEMAYKTTSGNALDEERLIHEILNKIQESSKETILWEKPLQTKIAEKRADFILNMHVGKEKNEISVSSSYPVDQEKKEIALLLENDSMQKQSLPILDLNNNIEEDTPVVCQGPCGDLRKVRQTTLVRRRSSVDSGIIVRTPSEKNEDRNRLVVIKSPVRRCKTSDEQLNGCKALDTQKRSTSLPNLNEIDLDKFELIIFDEYKMKQQEQTNDKTTAVKRSKNKALFSIKNYIRGKYRKTKLADLIKRNNTFSTGRQKSPRALGCKNDEDDDIYSISEDEGMDEVPEEYVLTFDVNSTDHHGDTCLHYASSKGDIDTIQYLLKSGGNVWLKNHDEQLPIDMSKDFRTAQLLSHATVFYTESEAHKKDCNISSTVKLAFDL